MTLKKEIPEQISSAVNVLLAPYGVNLDSLNQLESQIDEVRYLSVCAAEKYCGVSRWTIYRAVKSGKLRQIKLSSAQQGKVLFDRQDIDKWLKQHKSKHLS
jgi:excisionase family DNA binding protein